MGAVCLVGKTPEQATRTPVGDRKGEYICNVGSARGDPCVALSSQLHVCDGATGEFGDFVVQKESAEAIKVRQALPKGVKLQEVQPGASSVAEVVTFADVVPPFDALDPVTEDETGADETTLDGQSHHHEKREGRQDEDETTADEQLLAREKFGGNQDADETTVDEQPPQREAEGSKQQEDPNDVYVTLKKAVIEGDVLQVRNLLRSRVDVNHRYAFDLTPLHFAALHNQIEVTRELVDSGADLYAQTADEHKLIPAALAHMEGNMELIQVLILAERGESVFMDD